MELILDIINNYHELLLCLTLVLMLFAIISFFIVLRRLSITRKQYQTLLKGMENKNLETIILQNRDLIEYLHTNYKELDSRLKMMEINQDYCLKNVALERYDAFSETGGQQSFSVALLNDKATGVVITTIHSREDSRTYAKYIKDGKSEYALSEEEKRTIEKALN
ncbi:MAG: DUF4446 family protein [Clostridia bacterium]|jgi:hypothetical protein|nr:DUF4446 family protein [Clostridia bacterium]